MQTKDISDVAGTMWMIEWSDNNGGPDERIVSSSNQFSEIIVSQAREDPDATVKIIS